MRRKKTGFRAQRAKKTGKSESASMYFVWRNRGPRRGSAAVRAGQKAMDEQREELLDDARSD